MKTNIRVIDLAKYKAKDSKFIIGRENGANAMVKEDLKNFVKTFFRHVIILILIFF